MLVLTRTEGEAVLIGDNIRIIVARVNGGQIRIGVEAPLSCEIVRSELTQSADSYLSGRGSSPELDFD